VLDEVLLRELLDDLNLLDADGHLARDRATELDARASLGHEETDQLASRDERDGEAAAPASPRELGAELRQAEGLACGARFGIARRQVELLARGIEEVHVAGARAEQRARVRGDRLHQPVERLGPRYRLRELGELLELRDPGSRLLVLARVLDRAPDQRGRR